MAVDYLSISRLGAYLVAPPDGNYHLAYHKSNYYKFLQMIVLPGAQKALTYSFDGINTAGSLELTAGQAVPLVLNLSAPTNYNLPGTVYIKNLLNGDVVFFQGTY